MDTIFSGCEYVEALSVDLEGCVGLDKDGFIYRAGDKRKATDNEIRLIWKALVADL